MIRRTNPKTYKKGFISKNTTNENISKAEVPEFREGKCVKTLTKENQEYFDYIKSPNDKIGKGFKYIIN